MFDSRTPGLLQLGTVWLPLPHLLMIPFLLFELDVADRGSADRFHRWWPTFSGRWASFVWSATRSDWPQTGSRRPRIAAWGAAIIYAANPNLIYLQATAMTESLYLALFIWAVVYFSEFVQDAANFGESV